MDQKILDMHADRDPVKISRGAQASEEAQLASQQAAGLPFFSAASGRPMDVVPGEVHDASLELDKDLKADEPPLKKARRSSGKE